MTNSDLSGASWFKSSYSGSQSDCVEVAWLSSGVGVRDSKNPAGPALMFTASEWDAFARALRGGTFNR
ncbi:DUF397 domain-containing protein [Nocardia cyriacigeorgica]|uniref:DUF397 domain-containing protein n=1 Tax=Nocardia cyriacigeorgica TaxID=135487 RepID=A0A5R8NFI6_9NOCA|nr:DUF397 domain-containing protein [Nocardia cyriacigeorgica]TLF74495.1 DUF397 domain-containing protein [Nocardia cyriacigeorgica]